MLSSTPAVFTMQPSRARLPFSTASPPSLEKACSASRITPHSVDMQCCSAARTSADTTPADTREAPSAAQSRSGAGVVDPGASASRMSAAIRRANTSPSSSELEASRLAPCTPVQAASPQA